MKLFVVSALLALASAVADFIPAQSFSAPFLDVGADGSRVVTSWTKGGHAEIKENFVRLTPDRQSKQGAMWTTTNLDSNELAIVIKFRISGQGATLFGDGVGLWVTQHNRWPTGQMHGVTETFVGFGIVFDTFKNMETAAKHRDITVLINDGGKTQEEMTETPLGCNAALRYHEKRADFSVKQASRARITYKDGSINVQVDAQDDGDWVDCATVDDVKLPRNWLKKARLGLTATTGALADNHDILSIETYGTVAALEEAEAEAERQANVRPSRAINSERFNNMAAQLEDIAENSETLQHQIEHSMEAVKDSLQITINKLQEQENDAERRIEQLEERFTNRVEEAMEDRITKLEQQVQKKIDKGLVDRLQRLEKAMNMKIDNVVSESVGGMSSWQTPFLVLVVVLVAAAVGLYQWYQKLRKTHLL